VRAALKPSTVEWVRTMSAYDRITTTIERQYLAEIIAGTKKTEYRQIKPIGQSA
jgi:hypothetical protein